MCLSNKLLGEAFLNFQLSYLNVIFHWKILIQLLTFSIHACDNMDLISAIACSAQKWFTLLLFLLISHMLVLVYFYYYYIPSWGRGYFKSSYSIIIFYSVRGPTWLETRLWRTFKVIGHNRYVKLCNLLGSEFRTKEALEWTPPTGVQW